MSRLVKSWGNYKLYPFNHFFFFFLSIWRINSQHNNQTNRTKPRTDQLSTNFHHLLYESNDNSCGLTAPQLSTCVVGGRPCGSPCPCWLCLWWSWPSVWSRPPARTTCPWPDITPASSWVDHTSSVLPSRLLFSFLPKAILTSLCSQLSFGAFLGIVGIHLVENRRPMVSLQNTLTRVELGLKKKKKI